MSKFSNTGRVFEKLVTQALIRNTCGCPDSYAYEKALRDGTPIPEKCKPGYLLQFLDKDDRDDLKNLTSDYTRKLRLDNDAHYIVTSKW